MSTLSLPESLKQQIAVYEARLKRVETLLAVAGGVVGFLLMYVLLLGMDRLFDTPKFLRAALLTTGTSVAAVFARRWGRNWLWKRRSANQLTVLLGGHFRSLGDRLQGVLELVEAGELPANISPALCRAAIAQVAEESSRHDFASAVPQRNMKRWGWAAAGVIALTLVALAVIPRAATNAAHRFIAPWADVERYTFASLEALPNELFVAHGEPFSLEIGLKADSVWKPTAGSAQISTQEPLIIQLEDNRATLPIAPQTRDVTLSLRVGDATRKIEIHPLHRPELKRLNGRIEPPAYLKHAPSTKLIQGATAEFLIGSSVALEGTIARPLATAVMDGETYPATLSGETFVTAARVVDAESASFRLEWSDQYHLKPAQPYNLKILPLKDAEPKVEIKDLEPELAILGSELLKINFAASDDFGLKESWLGWTVSTTGPDKKVISKGETPHQMGAPTTVSTAGTIDWSPIWHKIPDDTFVELAAYTTDYFPDRKPSVSWKHTIWVLSPSKHAEKIRDRMDEVLKQLDDRIRDEERQIEENKAIAQRKDDPNSEKTAEEIKRLEAGERQNDEQLQKLAGEMENVMKEAMRNKEIPEKTLSEWNKITEKLQKDAHPEMQKAAEKMEQAANAKPSEGKPSQAKPSEGKPSEGKPGNPPPGEQEPEKDDREKALAEAQESQEKALDAMREAAKNINTANENLYARNFYNRLRHSAKQQHQVSADLQKLAKSTVGLTPKEIGEADKKSFDQSARKQDSTTSDVESIVNDMGMFIVRLPNEKYAAVHKDMEEKKVISALSELAGFVRSNWTLRSVGSAKSWGEQLDKWAALLQDESQPGGGGGGGGEMPPEMMELLIALVRAAQEQDNLREQTQALDGRQWTSDSYLEDAGKISELQARLAGSIAELNLKTPIEEAKPLLKEVHQMMTDISLQLGSPKTDKGTVAEQSIVIEMLVPPDKKSPKDSKGQSKSMAMMQQAAREMMAKGQKPGRNNTKGASDMQGVSAQGPAHKDKATQRNVDKASGSSSSSEWPTEFKDQLQSFFNNVESASDGK